MPQLRESFGGCSLCRNEEVVRPNDCPAGWGTTSDHITPLELGGSRLEQANLSTEEISEFQVEDRR